MVNRCLYFCCVVERHLPMCVLCLVSLVMCGFVYVDGGFEFVGSQSRHVSENGGEIGLGWSVVSSDVVPVLMQGDAKSAGDSIELGESRSGHSAEVADNQPSNEGEKAPVCHPGIVLLFWLWLGVPVGSMR